MGKIEARLKELGIALPRLPKRVANYVPAVKVGEILYVSGAIGTVVNDNNEDVLTIKGKVGRDVTIEEAYQSARLVTINHLAYMKAVLGDLDQIVRVVKLVGYVNAAPGFNKAPWVINGASDLLVEIFGKERGSHARAALYQNEMTRDAPVEIEMTVQVTP
jgi:enamine deaminase RidA (YjgF/YER057c/UK114 family)